MKNVQETPLGGSFIFDLFAAEDSRGTFVKTFNHTACINAGIPEFTIRESYYSLSQKDVIRGMHFQLPPHPLAKIVFCPVGAILDVLLDLRKSSPTYGRYFAAELSATNHKAFYIPEGFAHGFRALTDVAMTYYLVSREYAPSVDTGIHASGFGFDWGTEARNISDRDASFITLKDFDSPFA